MRIPINFLAKKMRKNTDKFDASFYMAHYEDLASLKSKKHAYDHYLRHGKSEGRFPNEQAFLEQAESLRGLRGGFDLAAYRFYNKDLAQRFETEAELFRHYVRHGHGEGRLCRFPEEVQEDELPRSELWKSIFSTAEFLAWCGDELKVLPASREEAIDIFCATGIDRLWPINFDYAFDVEFVRLNDSLPDYSGASDPDLYRAWLAQGFPGGVAPNERMYLATYLGGLPFPSTFNWQGFAQRSGMSSKATRSQAMISLFNAPERVVFRNIDMMGTDAAWLLDRIGRRALVQGRFHRAAAFLARSVEIVPEADTLCVLGDARRELGPTAEALDAYLASMTIDRAPIWVFLHAATIYAARNAFAEAFGVLRQAFPIWRQKTEFRRKLHEIIQLYFEHQSNRAHMLLREAIHSNCGIVSRSTVEELLTKTLDEIRAIYVDLDTLPAPSGGNSEGYVAILANDDLPQCTHYRIEQKVLEFEIAGIPVRVFSHSNVQEFLDNIVGARCAIFYRVAATPPVLRAILYADAMGLDTYYEVDDLIFDSSYYPDAFSSFEGQISDREYAGLQFGVPLFRYALSMCKSSIASTPALAERMQAVTVTGSGIVIRNGLDRRNEVAVRMGGNPLRREDARVRIFYGSGTKAHNADFNELAAPAIADLMKRHAYLELVIVGHLKLGPELSAFGERIIVYPFISDTTSYWSVLSACDINIAVLQPGPVADCKSEIKWLEAAVLQVPSVVSRTRTYGEVITDGVDGFLVDTPAQWLKALEQLVSQPSLRQQIGKNARRKVIEDYDPGVAASQLRATFGGSGRPARLAKPGCLRILVCNVFFAPQSYGGATRVVEDNVRTFTDAFPDLEIAVFCSDEGGTSAGHLSLGCEGGVPVYRLATAARPHMDWIAFDKDHAAPFERVLDHFKPDIVHFHCIQRLSATIVEVAARRSIPYVVTLHDAWWISDNQFLIDGDGLLRLASTDVLADCAKARDPLASVARRQRLSSLLNGSQANISVSAPFARIYADAGIARLSVIENGVPPPTTVIPSPRPDGRVALGHIGGRSAHKGAFLVEAALRQGDYRNLHLTMVDGTLAPNQTVETQWGTTPVTLTAPYPQSQVSDLYGRLNVLLAPSTWPESYGLVAREALNSGLWVVASNLGAIGQDIDDSRNGHVIDVTSARGLKAALFRIDSEPARYRAPPPPGQRPPRDAAAQAGELHALYHQIVSAVWGSQAQRTAHEAATADPV